MAESKFYDPRDRKIYSSVQIGNQIWMAENLAYDAYGSVCYNNSPRRGENYGRLYDWRAAMRVAPPGWHLPTMAEWDSMSNFIGGFSEEGMHLKAKGGWNSKGNGLDTYGFTALPGGSGNASGMFSSARLGGFWWCASEDSGNEAYGKFMLYDNDASGWGCSDKSYFYSVRCVKD
jgi:uncharacterized protein (TIGR02145 family)